MPTRLQTLLFKLRREALEKAKDVYDRKQSLKDNYQQSSSRQTRTLQPNSLSRLTPNVFISEIGPRCSRATLDQISRPSTSADQTPIRALLAHCDVIDLLSTKILEAREAPLPTESATMADPMAQVRAFIDLIFGAVGKVTRCFVCVADCLPRFFRQTMSELRNMLVYENSITTILFRVTSFHRT